MRFLTPYKIIAGVGFTGGFLVCLVSGAGRLGNAETAELTQAQRARVVAIHRQVNREVDRRGAAYAGPSWRIRWVGACLENVRVKHAALAAQLAAWNLPTSALSERRVRSPRGASAPFHQLLDLDATVDGRPWRVTFDMNSPWPLEGGDEAAAGYRNLPSTANLELRP